MARAEPVQVMGVRNGRGLVANRAFAAGDLVCRLHGRVVGARTVWRWWSIDPRRATNCIRFDAERYLDTSGGWGEFANHSCMPNAVIRRERGVLVLRAMRAIGPGTEVTHDYSTCVGTDDVWRMRCNCGASACRGVVGDVASIPVQRLRRYLAVRGVPAFIVAGMDP